MIAMMYILCELVFARHRPGWNSGLSPNRKRLKIIRSLDIQRLNVYLFVEHKKISSEKMQITETYRNLYILYRIYRFTIFFGKPMSMISWSGGRRMSVWRSNV